MAEDQAQAPAAADVAQIADPAELAFDPSANIFHGKMEKNEVFFLATTTALLPYYGRGRKVDSQRGEEEAMAPPSAEQLLCGLDCSDPPQGGYAVKGRKEQTGFAWEKEFAGLQWERKRKSAGDQTTHRQAKRSKVQDAATPCFPPASLKKRGTAEKPQAETRGVWQQEEEDRATVYRRIKAAGPIVAEGGKEPIVSGVTYLVKRPERGELELLQGAADLFCHGLEAIPPEAVAAWREQGRVPRHCYVAATLPAGWGHAWDSITARTAPHIFSTDHDRPHLPVWEVEDDEGKRRRTEGDATIVALLTAHVTFLTDAVREAAPDPAYTAQARLLRLVSASYHPDKFAPYAARHGDVFRHVGEIFQTLQKEEKRLRDLQSRAEESARKREEWERSEASFQIRKAADERALRQSRKETREKKHLAAAAAGAPPRFVGAPPPASLNRRVGRR
jgi:hypothetical protein